MKKKLLIAIITIIVIIVAAFTGSYFYTQSMLNKVIRKELPKTDLELGITPKTNDQPVVTPEKKEDIVNIAFFGVDRRNPDVASRSDSIMVVSINRKDQKVKVTSLMRDMYVHIPEKEDNRINAAYAIGDAPLAIKTINSNFGTDIRNYVTVDFFGLQDVIDKVGGVEINVKQNEIEQINKNMREVAAIEGTKIIPVTKAGAQMLNGMQSVGYSRIRYVGNSDYERTERQRRVLNEVFKKVKAQGAAKLPGTISTLLPYVETSLSNDEITLLALDAFKFDTQNIEQFRLPVDGTFNSQKIRGMAVLVPNIEENKSKLNEFIYGNR